jgi:hypothetical protein
MNVGSVVRVLDQTRLKRIADILVIGVAIALPWSTSATAILIVLWLVALLPTLNVELLRRELMTLPGGIPVLLWALAAAGMLWADVNWSERIEGLGAFHKLLMVPLLLAQFRRSDAGLWVVAGILASAVALLVVSFALAVIPGLPWRGRQFGVPVKDYISQSGIFVLCAFALLGRAAELLKSDRPQWGFLHVALAAAFVANVAYVVTGRTTLVVMAVFAVLFGLRQYGWVGIVGGAVGGSLLAGMIWVSSPYVRTRVVEAVTDVRTYQSGRASDTESGGLRLVFYEKSLRFVGEAPVFGHGTGSIRELFRRAATGEEGTAAAVASHNPHSQVFLVAIQLGLVGTAVLFAMWIVHLALFRGPSLAAWMGLLVVVQNLVSSPFNSHLADFNQGWLYVFGVGVLGGMVLRQASEPLQKPPVAINRT